MGQESEKRVRGSRLRAQIEIAEFGITATERKVLWVSRIQLGLRDHRIRIGVRIKRSGLRVQV
jgi:hypothetical protein